MNKVRSYQKLKEIEPIPNLVSVQLDSFNDFLQSGVALKDREERGLQAVFMESFPVESARHKYKLEFVSYQLGNPTYSSYQTIEQGVTYSAPLRGKFRLICYGKDEAPTQAIEQAVYLGQFPLMTERGTFIINGVERVIVSQLRRAPGVYFSDIIHLSGKRLFKGEIIPYRGSWISFESDTNDILHVSLDKRHKVLGTTLLRALGYESREEILRLFYKGKKRKLDNCEGDVLLTDIISDMRTREINSRATGDRREINSRATKDKVIVARAGSIIDKDLIIELKDSGVKELEVIKDVSPLIAETLTKDKIETKSQALLKIYSLLRGTIIQDPGVAESFFKAMYFSKSRYKLSELGRQRLNWKFGTDLGGETLVPEDFVNMIRGIISFSMGKIQVDDPDHIGNRQILRVGELLSDQLRIAFGRLAWSIKERMILGDTSNITPRSLMNVSVVSAILQKFFGSSQLSQFMEETNPLAELTHKRRVSRLGPGGLTRETAGLAARDVHYSHYGRICPIETPEGPNIGIITSLASYAKVSKYGEIKTPYRKVKNGKVLNEIEWLSANGEEEYTVAQANAPLEEDGRFKNPTVLSRRRSDFPAVMSRDIDYMDVSPKQLVSISTCLIPFLEHDDANRALMGSNMQRQAVPLLFPEAPIVGTGIEEKVVLDSGASIIARRGGKVIYVDGQEIIVRASRGKNLSFDRYFLRKFKRTNQDTCVNQRPLVKRGDVVRAGDIISDGAAVDKGEIALGNNVLVAFMPWRGYNFEDAIVVSESLLKKDTFTSITIEEFKIEARDTSLGPEQVTADVPNITDEGAAKLDEFGIVRIGCDVEPGDILVGKISPRGERELSPEERLLQAIFGEKAQDVKDSSLRVPSGVRGKVMDVRILTRKGDDPLCRWEFNHRVSVIKSREGLLSFVF